MNKLYQVQLETKNRTYKFEIATNDFDAVAIAQAFLLHNFPNLTLEDLHLGGYCEIGNSDKSGIIFFKEGLGL